jgi:hypothetical protein
VFARLIAKKLYLCFPSRKANLPSFGALDLILQPNGMTRRRNLSTWK